MTDVVNKPSVAPTYEDIERLITEKYLIATHKWSRQFVQLVKLTLLVFCLLPRTRYVPLGYKCVFNCVCLAENQLSNQMQLWIGMCRRKDIEG
jgi:hypothetical protein